MKELNLYVEIPENGRTNYPIAIVLGCIRNDSFLYPGQDVLIVHKPSDFPFKNSGYFYRNCYGYPAKRFQEVKKKAGRPRYLKNLKKLEKILEKYPV